MKQLLLILFFVTTSTLTAQDKTQENCNVFIEQPCSAENAKKLYECAMFNIYDVRDYDRAIVMLKKSSECGDEDALEYTSEGKL
jgi:hypothetical protein